MKIFISSLIGGMTEIRLAAREAVETLGHEAVMAEDFAAGPTPPRVACLSGLRNSAIVVLILGHEYGAKQASGLSATHEEYREAKGHHPVIAFRQAGTVTDADQLAFISEVESWEEGLFRGEFASSDELRAKITLALHQWEVSRAASPLDADALLEQAISQIPEENRGFSQPGVSLWISVAAGPRQAILRPSELEATGLQTDLMKEAMFGSYRIFDPKLGSDSEIDENTLTVFQGNRTASIRVNSHGDLLIKMPTSRSSDSFVLIEEDVADSLEKSIGYVAWVLDRLDQTQRISHVALAVALRGSEMVVWRTQAEHNKSPTSYSMGMGRHDRAPIHLSPPHKTRSALAFDITAIGEDLITLIRRQVKG